MTLPDTTSARPRRRWLTRRRGASGDQPAARCASGFTLVEVMIAMVLGALILGGGFMALRTGFTILEQSRDNTRVAQILQSEMERLRGLRFENIAALSGSQTFTPSDSAFSSAFANRYTLTRTVTFTHTGQYSVRLRATWAVHGVQKQQDFITLFTQNGLNDYYFARAAR